MIAFLCVSLALFIAGPAFAQCNRGIIVRGNTVCNTPVVVTNHVDVVHEIITPIAIPVALPVIVPAFTYQYVPPVTVAQAVPVYPGAPAPLYTQPAMPQYAQPAMPQYNGPYQTPPVQPQQVAPAVTNNDKLKELARLLLEEMRRQDSQNNGTDDGPPMAIYPTPNNVPAITPAVSLGKPNPQSPYAQAAINAFARNCMNCHTGPGSKGEVVIFSQLNLLNPDAPFKTMLSEINRGHMPPRDSNYRPTQEEVRVMIAWLEGK